MNSFFFVISATDEEKHQEPISQKRSRNLFLKWVFGTILPPIFRIRKYMSEIWTFLGKPLCIIWKLSKRQMLEIMGGNQWLILANKEFFLILFDHPISESSQSGNESNLKNSSAIVISQIKIPPYVIVGQTVHLYCLFELRNGTDLYTLKWFKDGAEFYRSVPRASVRRNRRLIFPMPGVKVDFENSKVKHTEKT